MKLSLDKTWKKQLQLSGWVAERQAAGDERTVGPLKRKWLELYGYNLSDIAGNCFYCFFCDYDNGYKGGCSSCPGRLIDKDFSCSNPEYSWWANPIDFYEKLLKLHAKYEKTQKCAKKKTN